MSDEKKDETKPTTREKTIRIAWRWDVPDVADLTGADAKRALVQVLLEHRRAIAQAAQLDGMRRQLSSLVVAFVHRDNMRGLLGTDGHPITPMISTLPAASATLALEPWNLVAQPSPDGSVVVSVERASSPAADAPRIIP